MTSRNFQTLFDVTTAHLRPRDAALLDEFRNEDNTFKAGSPVVIYGFEYGWTVSTSGGIADPSANADEVEAYRKDKLEKLREAGFSKEFMALVTHAWENGAVMIRFDADADPEPGFPLFDLETGRVIDDEPDEEPTAPAP